MGSRVGWQSLNQVGLIVLKALQARADKYRSAGESKEFSDFLWDLRMPGLHPQNLRLQNHRASIPFILRTLYKSKTRC